MSLNPVIREARLPSALLALAFVGAPLFVIITVVTALCWCFYSGEIESWSGLTRLVTPLGKLIEQDQFMAIPLFIGAGAIMTEGGLAKRLVDVARAGLGWAPGGLAMTSVIACMFFAAISGSSPVTLIAVGSIMVPAMVKNDYPEDFSLGLVMTAGSLGCLIPPAIAMLIYAISVQGTGAVNPEDLFIAGLGPAFFIVAVLMIYSWWVGRKIKTRDPFSPKAFFEAMREGVWALALPVVILGGIYGGLYVPSEAGAVAVVYSLVITGFVYRELDFIGVLRVLANAGKLMGLLILIIGLAFSLNNFLAAIQIDEKLQTLVTHWDLGPVGFLLLVNVVLIVLGALMDSISATLIFAPMLAPIAVDVYGMDALHFGIVFVVNMEIGYLMPPVATNLFVAAAVFKKPFGQVAKAVVPTLLMTIAALGLFMFFPTCSKGLVNAKNGDPIYEPFPWSRGDATGRKAAPGGAAELGKLSVEAMEDSEEKDGGVDDDQFMDDIDDIYEADDDDTGDKGDKGDLGGGFLDQYKHKDGGAGGGE